MEQKQSQYQGAERRQSQTQYQGDERRKPDPIFEQTTWIPGNPGTAPEPEGEQEQQHDDKH